MKTLYYTVTKQLVNIDGFEETNGYKDISVYEIVNNKPNFLFQLEVSNECSSKEEILDNLDSNVYDNVKLIEL